MTTTTASTTSQGEAPRLDPDLVSRALAKRAFCTLATTSPAGRPHVAGVLYELVDDPAGQGLYVNTLRSSRKARNVAANAQVAVCVPIRRLPVGPPSSVQFQTTAEVLPVDHPDVVALLAAGQLGSITGHGELELPDDCFLRIHLPHRLVTYGLGMPIRRLIRDPLNAAGVVELG